MVSVEVDVCMAFRAAKMVPFALPTLLSLVFSKIGAICNQTDV